MLSEGHDDWNPQGNFSNISGNLYCDIYHWNFCYPYFRLYNSRALSPHPLNLMGTSVDSLIHFSSYVTPHTEMCSAYPSGKTPNNGKFIEKVLNYVEKKSTPYIIFLVFFFASRAPFYFYFFGYFAAYCHFFIYFFST